MNGIAPEIRELLEARRSALLTGDADALERLLHPDFRYVDSLGRELDRAAYLASRRSGEITFARHDLTEVVARELVHREAVLVTCQVHDVGAFQGKPFESRCRAVHVCIFDRARWAFLFGQSTSMDH